jgi:hypothetical protein
MAGFALPAGLVIQLAICGLFTFGACGSCRAGGDWISAIGGLGYAALLVALIVGLDLVARVGTAIAFATHAVLAYEMFSTGVGCGLCIAAAFVSVPTFAASCVLEPANVIRAGIALPVVGVILMGALSVTSLVEEPPAKDKVTLTIFEIADCEFCKRLKSEVLPTLRDLPLTIRFQDANAVSVPMKLPTIVVAKGETHEIIEGLPPAEYLRAVICEVAK